MIDNHNKQILKSQFTPTIYKQKSLTYSQTDTNLPRHSLSFLIINTIIFSSHINSEIYSKFFSFIDHSSSFSMTFFPKLSAQFSPTRPLSSHDNFLVSNNSSTYCYTFRYFLCSPCQMNSNPPISLSSQRNIIPFEDFYKEIPLRCMSGNA